MDAPHNDIDHAFEAMEAARDKVVAKAIRENYSLVFWIDNQVKHLSAPELAVKFPQISDQIFRTQWEIYRQTQILKRSKSTP